MLAGALHLPRHRELREDWPFDFDVLDAVLGDPDAMYGKPSPDDLLATDYLLGYPSH